MSSFNKNTLFNSNSNSNQNQLIAAAINDFFIKAGYGETDRANDLGNSNTNEREFNSGPQR